MTRGSRRGAARYALGIGAVSAGALLLSFLLAGPARAGMRFALGLSLVVQGPLGWWLVSSVGGPRLMAVWTAGMAVRCALLVLLGTVLVPALGLPLPATLFSLAALLLAFLLVEGAALIGRTEIEER